MILYKIFGVMLVLCFLSAGYFKLKDMSKKSRQEEFFKDLQNHLKDAQSARICITDYSLSVTTGARLACTYKNKFGQRKSDYYSSVCPINEDILFKYLKRSDYEQTQFIKLSTGYEVVYELKTEQPRAIWGIPYTNDIDFAAAELGKKLRECGTISLPAHSEVISHYCNLGNGITTSRKNYSLEYRVGLDNYTSKVFNKLSEKERVKSEIIINLESVKGMRQIVKESVSTIVLPEMNEQIKNVYIEISLVKENL